MSVKMENWISTRRTEGEMEKGGPSSASAREMPKRDLVAWGIQNHMNPAFPGKTLDTLQ